MKYLLVTLSIVSLVVLMACPPHPPKQANIETPQQPSETTTNPELPNPKEEPSTPPLQLSAIYFDYDKYDIRSDAREILSQNSKSLTEHPTATIRIEGNCDERGTEQYNLALGEKRANAARDYLINYGIAASRIATITYGKERPVAKGHDEGAWAKNRRDDFVIMSE